MLECLSRFWKVAIGHPLLIPCLILLVLRSSVLPIVCGDIDSSWRNHVGIRRHGSIALLVALWLLWSSTPPWCLPSRSLVLWRWWSLKVLALLWRRLFKTISLLINWVSIGACLLLWRIIAGAVRVVIILGRLIVTSVNLLQLVVRWRCIRWSTRCTLVCWKRGWWPVFWQFLVVFAKQTHC